MLTRLEVKVTDQERPKEDVECSMHANFRVGGGGASSCD